MRSLDPRLPVLVGLGAASEPAPVVDLMTEAVRCRGGRRRRPRAASPHRLHRRAPGHVVAHRPGAHRGPAHRVARGAHAPLRDRRLPTGGHQPRAGGRGGRARRHRRRRRRRGAGAGPATAASRRTRRPSRPTRCSPGRPTSWPRWSWPPASSCRPCSSTRSLRTPWPPPKAPARPPARRDRRAVGALQRGGGRQPRGGVSRNPVTPWTSPRPGRTTARWPTPTTGGTPASGPSTRRRRC